MNMYKIKVLLVLIFCNLLGSSYAQDLIRLGSSRFTENKGQWHNSYNYKSEVPNGNMYLMNNAIGYHFYDGEVRDKMRERLKHIHDGDEIDTSDVILLPQHIYKVSFLNSNPNVSVQASEPYGDKINILKGNREDWHTGIRSYAKLKYSNLYSGTDLQIYSDGYAMKYEFHLEPGEDWKTIELKYEGADQLSLINGRLHIKTSVNEIVEEEPYAYQIIDGAKVEVPCKYKLRNNIVSYKLRKVNPDYPLVIDPEVIFSTSSGSTADNWGNTACYDERGNAYLAGTVFPTNNTYYGVEQINGELYRIFGLNEDGFPTTFGAFQSEFEGGYLVVTDINGVEYLADAMSDTRENRAETDIAIMKFDSSGTSLLYSTYLGGEFSDVPISSVTNIGEELFLLSVTSSSDFPNATNTFSGGNEQDALSIITLYEGSDIVISRISFDGADVVSRFIGGSANDGFMPGVGTLVNNYGDELRGDIIVGTDNNIYATSMTTSLDFPVTNATAHSGGIYDAVIFSMPQDLSGLNWSTYYGGSADDATYSIQEDPVNGVFYIAGGTLSDDLPSANSTRNGDVDGFVAQVAFDGSVINASHYLGTPQFDQAYFVDVDAEGDVYAFGQTKGAYPVSDTSLYHNKNAGLFIHKFLSDLATTDFSITFGSENASADNIVPPISPTAFLVNDCENIFLSGWGGNTNGRSRGGGLMYNGGGTVNMPLRYPEKNEAQADSNDFYLAVILADAEDLLVGTYFGGSQSDEHVDGGTSRFDKRGVVYQAVCGGCGGNQDFPTIPDDGDQNTYPKRNASFNCNAAIFKYQMSAIDAQLDIIQDNCTEDTVFFANNTTGGLEYLWYFGDGDSLYIRSLDTVSHVYAEKGEYDVMLIAFDITTCTRVDTAFGQVSYSPDIEVFVGQDTLCYGDSTRLIVSGAVNPFWSPADDLSCVACENPIARPSQTNNVYVVRDSVFDNCVLEKQAFIYRYPRFDVEFSTIGRACTERTIEFINTSGSSATDFKWDFGEIGSVIQENNEAIVPYTYGGSGEYRVILYGEHISGICNEPTSDTLIVSVLDSMIVKGDTSICPGESALLSIENGTNSYWLSHPTLDCINSACQEVIASPLATTVYYAKDSLNPGCTFIDSVVVSVYPEPEPRAIITLNSGRCIETPYVFSGSIVNNDCICCKPVVGYEWDFGDNSSSTEAEVVHNYDTQGNYTVIFSVYAHDTIRDTMIVTVNPNDSCLKNVYIPNAFTPNDDGMNDVLYVRGINITELKFEVFNRTGELVFETNSLSKGWDGIYKGVKQSPQVFTYTCHVTFWDGEERQLEGNVTLIE